VANSFPKPDWYLNSVEGIVSLHSGYEISTLE
jgi:hypothetical protein